MNEVIAPPTPTWSTWRDLGRVITYPRHLKRAVTVAVIVGTVFFGMNQLGLVLAGHATPIIWFKSALTYLTPFCVSNIGVVSATRRRDKMGKEDDG